MRESRRNRLLGKIEARHAPPERRPGFCDHLLEELQRLPADASRAEAVVAYWKASQRCGDFEPTTPAELLQFCLEHGWIPPSEAASSLKVFALHFGASDDQSPGV